METKKWRFTYVITINKEELTEHYLEIAKQQVRRMADALTLEDFEEVKE